ncbi:MAG: methionine--tRNA ligase [Candidatus Raymondbacteria bacterium RifOxyC12_full_50_8]|uniref:Methionine--tRNA ligase n=1 Tax=Candidatus Raymondbacteria bacterium RIFOXYD12_FULL_49_13 TaxID=1817890 RepID=A0A1F7FGK4_UNCRA|nr:MAG: methionine--tRNA ligase [Candidatus Raymondbacteria bacterium RIFOXYA2_FULL_49_16]OGJ99839.1 MAG: methionine--tRNA ligase [Candidatus Raymondbacteria bacterium RifOxyB12_full_50_8]OGK02502.1 MAG: methionine--tRNA ligase [Candidatus Raymondbacteria bacterium RifOxyC12_full_50_8]OGK05839.1 MAG: methionine--tRNA ligase [Candidatus Raymondbacteria bacterium RIFOXYD12_FULL_49_13]OGP43332.1 MAG: methionine--tRNA ligase [Candidatus Raymondbacteria bacterium RIFOXYB2_FULL_49_35]
MERYLVTAALPYANGPLHLGHIAGAYLPADIFVRFLRLTKHDAVFICGTDEHGVPITLAAEKRAIAPKVFVDEVHAHMEATFAALGISFDNFSGTARPAHYETTIEFFLDLDKKGFLEKKSIVQLYCGSCNRFLPDRYVEGVCPRCSAAGARGDQCEACGSDLDQTELVNPYCKICGAIPVMRETSHWFLKLSDFEGRLREWLESKRVAWKENVVNFCNGLLAKGLPDRAITRDLDWGVPVPLPGAEGKVIYVWFDAPIGYISSTKEWALKKGDAEAWKKYWQDPDTRVVHFIGKDNIVFHSLMWPAVLMGKGGYNLPWHIPANEFLNIEGKKISTSRGFAIWAHEFIESFPADALRYYLAIIAPEAKDADFTFKEFQASYNNELADILGNFINRTITFIEKYYNAVVPPLAGNDAETAAMLARIDETGRTMEQAYAHFQVRRAAGLFMDLCRDANKYFNDKAPWKSRKEDSAACGSALHCCLRIIRALAVYGSPLIPFTCAKVQAMFSDAAPLDWKTADAPLIVGAPVKSPGILFPKIEDAAIAAEAERFQKHDTNVPHT